MRFRPVIALVAGIACQASLLIARPVTDRPPIVIQSDRSESALVQFEALPAIETLPEALGDEGAAVVFGVTGKRSSILTRGMLAALADRGLLTAKTYEALRDAGWISEKDRVSLDAAVENGGRLRTALADDLAALRSASPDAFLAALGAPQEEAKQVSFEEWSAQRALEKKYFPEEEIAPIQLPPGHVGKEWGGVQAGRSGDMRLNALDSGDAGFQLEREADLGGGTEQPIAFAVANDTCQSTIGNAAFQLTPGVAVAGNTCNAVAPASDSPAGNTTTCGTSVGAAPDMWYWFDATTTGDWTASICGASYDSKLYVYLAGAGASTNCPPAASCVGGSDDACGAASQLTFAATAGNRYLVRIAGFSSNCGNFSLVLSAPAGAPSNDTCAGATLVSVPSTTAGTTVGASADAGLPACGTTGSGDGVWYRVVGTGATLTAATCGLTTNDTVIRVFTGTCAGLTCVGGNDDGCGAQSTFTWPSVNGQNYFILVNMFGTTEGTFSLQMSASGGPPANDLCANATPLTVGGPVVSGSTIGATTDAGAPTCGQTSTNPGVWYTVTGTGNFITVSTCNSTTFDAVIRVFTGSCASLGTLTCVGSADGGCPSGSFTPASVTFCSVSGQQYLVLVSHWGSGGSSTGNFDISAVGGTSCAPPANDNCATPQTVAIPSTTPGQTNTATASVPNPPTCGQTSAAKDVWYRIVGNGQQLTVGTCLSTTFDAVVQVYTGGCAALTCAVPGADGGCPSGGLTPAQVTFCSVLGQEYLVRVAAWSSTATGAFVLSVSTSGTPCGAPGNDACANAFPVNVNTVTAGTSLNATVDTVPACQPADFTGVPATPGVWYTVVGNGAQITASTCSADGGSTSFDTVIKVYCNSCTSLFCVANNDDGGTGCPIPSGSNFASRVTWCSSPGQVYRILVHGYPTASPNSGPFSLAVTSDGVPCANPAPCAPPANDTCDPSNPLLVPGAGYVNGHTVGATADPNAQAAEICGPGSDYPDIALHTGPGVWYRVLGTGSSLTVDTCGSQLDTIVSVYCGSCTTLACAGGNDQSCGNGSSVTWCSAPGVEYRVLVSGFGTSTGTFQIRLTEGAACSDPPSCTPCVADCPPGAFLENEPNCGQPTDTVNGGANSPGCPQTLIFCGQTVCGTTFGSPTLRELDWYRLIVTQPSRVSWCAETEFFGSLQIRNDCAAGTAPFAAPVSACSSGCVTADLMPGSYSLVITPLFLQNDACGTAYTATVSCEPIGACCHADTLDCDFTTAAECFETGGEYLGDGVPCSLCFGACCLPGGGHECLVTTASQCTSTHGGSYLGPQTTCSQGDYVAEPNLAIPDNNATGVTHTITVTDSFDILDLDVDLAVDHSWVGDLIVELTHGATTVRLIERAGLATPTGCCGCSTDDYDILLDDEAVTPIEGVCPATGPITGTYRPGPTSAPFSNLSAFDFFDAAGTWTLRISDNAAIDTGSLVRWSLHFEGGPPNCNEPPTCNAGGPYSSECNTAIVSGATASDIDGDPLTYAWSSSNPDVVVLNGSGDVPPNGAIPPAAVVLAGGVAPCGVTATLTLTVDDGLVGGTATCTTTITFDDQTAPTFVDCPAPVTVECGFELPPPAAPTATDNCDDDVTVTYLGESAPNGPPCDYTVTRTWVAVDDCGNETTCTQTLRVVDTTAPTFTTQPRLDGLDCNYIWPPEHGYVTYQLANMGGVAVDNCGGPVTLRIVGCQSSQPEDDSLDGDSDINGDGRSFRDCVIADDGQSVSVRAERSASCHINRSYSITVEAVDACGNATPSATTEACVWANRGDAPPGPYRGSDDGTNQGSVIPGQNGTYGTGCGNGCTNCD